MAFAVGGFRAHVVVDFAARAARAGVAHGPEIILQAGNFDDAIFGRADFLPEGAGFVVGRKLFALADGVAAEHGEIELFAGNAEPFRRGEEFPGEGDEDDPLLEIVAEGKIAEHLEKSVVAIREAYVFQVVVLAPGADAFLASGRAVVVALLQPEKHILELVHPRVGEKQRGVVRRDERGAAHDAVAALLEESQERLADFVAGHQVQMVVLESRCNWR